MSMSNSWDKLSWLVIGFSIAIIIGILTTPVYANAQYYYNTNGLQQLNWNGNIGGTIYQYLGTNLSGVITQINVYSDENITTEEVEIQIYKCSEFVDNTTDLLSSLCYTPDGWDRSSTWTRNELGAILTSGATSTAYKHSFSSTLLTCGVNGCDNGLTPQLLILNPNEYVYISINVGTGNNTKILRNDVNGYTNGQRIVDGNSQYEDDNIAFDIVGIEGLNTPSYLDYDSFINSTSSYAIPASSTRQQCGLFSSGNFDLGNCLGSILTQIFGIANTALVAPVQDLFNKIISLPLFDGFNDANTAINNLSSSTNATSSSDVLSLNYNQLGASNTVTILWDDVSNLSIVRQMRDYLSWLFYFVLGLAIISGIAIMITRR